MNALPVAVLTFESAGSSIEWPGDGYDPLSFASINTVKYSPSACDRHSRRSVSLGTLTVMGPVATYVSTAFLGHFDFIYALPSAWLSVPFTFLGKCNATSMAAQH